MAASKTHSSPVGTLSNARPSFAYARDAEISTPFCDDPPCPVDTQTRFGRVSCDRAEQPFAQRGGLASTDAEAMRGQAESVEPKCRMPAQLPACLPACLPCLPACLPAWPACLPACLPAFVGFDSVRSVPRLMPAGLDN